MTEAVFAGRAPSTMKVGSRGTDLPEEKKIPVTFSQFQVLLRRTKKEWH
jgi:hypothetical protein